nr:ORF6N domain-containing protein [Anaerobacillus isosaccharinicus]QOY38538.1 ORF6N domain-containing protein [Anaerobacillus isosaccharinicus]
MNIPNITGGFGPNKKAMLVKHIADIHNKQLKHVNELINSNKHRFRENVDIIDVKQKKDFVVVLTDHNIFSKMQIAKANSIYLVSERGYAKLIKLFEDDKAWELYDNLLDEYFDFRDGQITQTSSQTTSPAEMILQLATQLVHHERKVKELDHRTAVTEQKVTHITKFLTETPTREKLYKQVLLYARHIGQRNINLAWGEVYSIVKSKYGLDIPARVERAKSKIQRDRIAEGKDPYALSTLEQKINGLDIVFQEKVENEVMEIVTGLISKVLRR